MICRVDGVECGRSFFKAIRSVVVVIVPVSVISSVVVRIVIRGSGVVAVVMIRAIPRSLAASPRRISVISSIVEGLGRGGVVAIVSHRGQRVHRIGMNRSLAIGVADVVIVVVVVVRLFYRRICR